MLRVTVLAVIEAAFRREVDGGEDEEIDLTLQELDGAEKKTPPAGSFGRDI